MVIYIDKNTFKFFIGANGVAENPYEIEDWRFLPTFLISSKENALKYDYALVKLKETVAYN
jgi:hypothetical protein